MYLPTFRTCKSLEKIGGETSVTSYEVASRVLNHVQLVPEHM
jgi:hypothetical protein